MGYVPCGIIFCYYVLIVYIYCIMDLEIGKTYKITWLENGFIQYKKLIEDIRDYELYYTFTINSPIYKATVNGSFCFELPYSRHCFKIENS